MARTLYPTSRYGNITLTTGSAHGYSTCTAINVTGGGTGGSSGTYTLSGTQGAGVYTTSANPYVTVGATTKSALKVSGDADISGELKVGGISINETLAKINERLAILVPDPALLEKYEALKQAYDQYKLLEALCVNETNSGEKK